MSPMFCSAPAYATELSERTFAAIAALIGAAMFALISDIAARSGSSSPASSFSSSRVRCLYWTSSPIGASLRALRDVADVLLGARVRERVVTRDVQRGREVDRRRDVGIDQGHCGALGQLFAGKRVQLLASELPVLLR